jgi:hypothetical protein
LEVLVGHGAGYAGLEIEEDVFEDFEGLETEDGFEYST